MLDPNYWNQRIHHEIPATQLLGITIEILTLHEIQLSAPLNRNINGHQTAFAGSIYTLGITSGWTFISALLKYHDIRAAVVAGKADILYRKPIKGNLFSRCQLNSCPLSEWQSMWQSKKSARQILDIKIGSQNEHAATLSATFFIKRL
jgi:thioesterase domain-containing protein